MNTPLMVGRAPVPWMVVSAGGDVEGQRGIVLQREGQRESVADASPRRIGPLHRRVKGEFEDQAVALIVIRQGCSRARC